MGVNGVGVIVVGVCVVVCGLVGVFGIAASGTAGFGPCTFMTYPSKPSTI